MSDDYWMNHLDVMTDESCPNAPHDHCYRCAEQAQAKLKARIAQLEKEAGKQTRYIAAQIETFRKQVARIAELEAAIKQAPCPVHVQREADKGACACCDCYGDSHQCDCWKIDAFKEQDE